jgi:hypothetical protein
LTSSVRKRYLLLSAEGGLSSEDEKRLTRLLEERYERFSLIRVRGHQDHMIVKTDGRSAEQMRELFDDVEIEGKRVRSVLTSGCIGKLKRRAGESQASVNAEVP